VTLGETGRLSRENRHEPTRNHAILCQAEFDRSCYIFSYIRPNDQKTGRGPYSDAVGATKRDGGALQRGAGLVWKRVNEPGDKISANELISAYCSAMPPDEDNQTKTPEPERTPAYTNGFGPNTDKLSHLLTLGQKALEGQTAEVKTVSAGLVGLSGTGGEQAEKIRTIAQDVLKQVTDLTGGVLIVHEMMPVLFVAIVEAYLKDVLIFAAGIDSSLMDGKEPTVTYPEALNAKSLEEVLIKFRSKWARKFVDSGGPTTWIESLEAMGARGYRPETVNEMETFRDVRHLIVHSAAIADAEFVRRHPELKAEVGKRFIVNGEKIKQWGDAMYDFVDITDQYFVRRCQKSRRP
jgi:hypothetical protein